MKTVSFEISDKLEDQIERIATAEDTSFDQAAFALLSYAAENVCGQKTIAERATRAQENPGRASEILRNARKVDLEPGDELPDNFDGTNHKI